MTDLSNSRANSETPSPAENNGGAEVLQASAVPFASISLASLAPRFDESQHQTYLARLNEVVADTRNRNIALTGRYGTGKSSVLDSFADTREHTLRLAISTLGADSEGATTTNRIQKELVKQLIYSASPRTLRHSRFSRVTTLSTKRASVESVAAVGVAGLLLGAVGWLPPLIGTGDGQPWLAQAALWIAFGLLLAVPLTVLRLVTYDRFMVSDVSAAGAAVKLSARTHTYFDEYLEEIVNYFDEEPVDIVVLEDLDRFNDPQIFEALRELNTLLNATPKRKASGKPLQFVYAVRDSLFEKLGKDSDQVHGNEIGPGRAPRTKAKDDDAATAETERANRTKFFDIVIPMVPFISHRNAQDLLHRLLTDAGISGIDRRLIDLVAQYATDMRLLRNMRNEYLVFADRLLEQEKVAPGLGPSGLFALVVYKNFHLKDFEEISRRSSDLDKLYTYRRTLVRTSIAAKQRRKRDILAGRAQIRTMERAVVRLGTRLQNIAALLRDTKFPGWTQFEYGARGDDYEPNVVTTYEFWLAVAEDNELTIKVASHSGAVFQTLITFTGDQVAGLFPEVAEARRWLEIDEEKTRAAIEEIDRDVAFLRGADFQALAARDDFALTIDVDEDSDAEQVARTFGQLVEDTLKSKLAVDLVGHGYISRDFSLYAAQFYGDFSGVDVATFIVHSVQPNVMDVDFEFTSPGAVQNLLEAVSDDFTHAVAAYNVDVVNHLLANNNSRIENILADLVDHFDTNAEEFLTAYMGSGTRREDLAARLSSWGWSQTFAYLVGEDVPADVRAAVVDAALLAVTPRARYDTNDAVSDFILEHYTGMTAFKNDHGRVKASGVRWFLDNAGLRVPDLSAIHETLREELVKAGLYELTAANLSTALGVGGDVSLDRIRSHDDVWTRCLSEPDRYLALVAEDEATEFSVKGPVALAAALTAVDKRWVPGHIAELIATSGPESTIPLLADVPTSTWPALADECRFTPSLTNVEAYRVQAGGIDPHLARLLTTVGAIEVDQAAEDVDPTPTAVALLNADSIEDARKRVDLARSLGVATVPVEQITPVGGPLLAFLLEHNLVPDDATTFSRFKPYGWSAIGPAIAASENFESFMSPAVVDGMVPELLRGDEITSARLGPVVVENLSQYVPADDLDVLSAAAEFALSVDIAVPAEQVRRIAVLSSSPDLVMRLLASPAQNATAEEVVATFAELDAPYNHVTTRAEAQFEVPGDDVHRTVFRKLSDANLCHTDFKRRKTPVIEVELT